MGSFLDSCCVMVCSAGNIQGRQVASNVKVVLDCSGNEG